MDVSDLDLLLGALTIFGEARGSTQEDRLAVAHVILNRARARKWWGQNVPPYRDHSIAAVCLKPYQFSCWNPRDPNLGRLEEFRKAYGDAIELREGRASLKALIDALDGYAPDPTAGATHYLTTLLHTSNTPPLWAAGRTDFIEIGAHRFFKDVD